MRRVLQVGALTAALVAAYGAGVLTGASRASQPTATLASAQRVSVIDEAAQRIASEAEHPVDRSLLERAAVEGMLKALGDKWSNYYAPAEFASFQDALEGRYTGVGLWLRPLADGRVEIGSVQPGSPAAAAGVLAGDVLVSVGGTAVLGRGVDDVATLLQGPAGSKVSVVVDHLGAQRRVTMPRVDFTAADLRIERLKGSVMLIKISAFTRGVGRGVRAALAADPSTYRGGIVLDMRGDPGGLLAEAVEVASVFLDGGPVVSYDRRGYGRTTLDALGHGDTTTPLVVLVDGQTASAAEVVTAALQDRNRAVVVGSRTFGKGSVQEPTRLSDGSAIELTVGRYYTPDGRSIDGVGVLPDVLVPATDPPATAERRAIEVLTELVAALTPGSRG